jgi:hypothetical protein
MKKNIQLLGILILLTGFCLWSCEGPQGPEGPQGQQGIQGYQGAQGNANVQCEKFDVSDWYNSTSDSSLYTDLAATNVTSDIVNNGIVKVVMNIQLEDTIWFTLPYTFVYTSPYNYSETYDYYYWEGIVEIIKFRNNGTTPTTPSERWFKVITIAGEAVSVSSHFKSNNFTESKKVSPIIAK